MPGLYIHIPFCVQKCPYCDFFSCDDRIYLLDDYLEALFRELKYYKDKYNPSFETLFVGGGTPSIMTKKQLDYFFTRIYGMVDRKKLKEITMEANPETINEKNAKVLAANVSRLSMGAQSLNDNFLKTLGRIHDSEKVLNAVDIVKKQGIQNISIDLMYGIPGQKTADALLDIKKVTAAGIRHVSYYMLTVYEHTPFAGLYKEGAGMPAEEEIEKMYFEGAAALEAAGIKQYEISNFAEPGKECQHNLNYWNSGEYAGLGAAASSYFAGLRYTNVKSIEEYIKRLKTNSDPAEISEKCTGEMKLKEYIMLRLRMKNGINYAEFKSRFGFDFQQKYSNIIAKHARSGALTADDTGIRLTLKGFILSNDVISEFF